MYNTAGVTQLSTQACTEDKCTSSVNAEPSERDRCVCFIQFAKIVEWFYPTAFKCLIPPSFSSPPDEHPAYYFTIDT